MLKKHLFLVLGVCAVVLMIAAGGLKLATGGARGPAGPGGGGPGAGAGGPGGPGGPGGAGGGRGPGARRGLNVTAASPVLRTFVDRIEVLGAAKARQSITLSAPTQQLVSRVLFSSGQNVRKGQVLFELTATEQEAGIAQAQSAVDYAKSTWQRWQQLADRGVAPAATAEQYKSQYEQAVANLNANKARLGDRVIRAPFAGTIGLTDAAPGMLLAPGATIATLDDLTIVKVDFPVPERFIPVLKDGLAIDATADAYPATTFRGRIAKVDTRIDPATRAVTARAEFPNTDRRLKTGMLLHVKIDQAVRRSPAVPEESVVFENGEAYVLLIQPGAAGGPGAPGQARGGPGAFGGQPAEGGRRGDGQGGQGGFGGRSGQGGQGGFGGRGGNLIAVRHVIGTGLRQDGWVEVTSGLQPDERIVADGSNRIRPNDPVQIVGFAGAPGGQGGAGRDGGGRGEGGRGGAAPVGPAGPDQTPAGGQGGESGQGGRPDPAATFAAADADRDGVVTRQEWAATGRPEGFFDRLDADHDGKVTRGELQAFARARAAGGGRGI